MKRLKFKKPFNGMDNAKKLIPESYKVDGNEFEITDGNETYRVKWSSLINEGIVLTSSNKAQINEDMGKMKHLMGFKSQDTLGTVKGAARLDENKKFGNILGKTKNLLNEGSINEALNKSLMDFGMDIKTFLESNDLEVKLAKGNAQPYYEPIGKNPKYAGLVLDEGYQLFIIVNDSRMDVLEGIVKKYNLKTMQDMKKSGGWDQDSNKKTQSEGEIYLHDKGRKGECFELVIMRFDPSSVMEEGEHIKSGMGGSNKGKGRTDKTEVLKKDSKRKRRKADKEATKDINENDVEAFQSALGDSPKVAAAAKKVNTKEEKFEAAIAYINNMVGDNDVLKSKIGRTLLKKDDNDVSEEKEMNRFDGDDLPIPPGPSDEEEQAAQVYEDESEEYYDFDDTTTSIEGEPGYNQSDINPIDTDLLSQIDSPDTMVGRKASKAGKSDVTKNFSQPKKGIHPLDPRKHALPYDLDSYGPDDSTIPPSEKEAQTSTASVDRYPYDNYADRFDEVFEGMYEEESNEGLQVDDICHFKVTYENVKNGDYHEEYLGTKGGDNIYELTLTLIDDNVCLGLVDGKQIFLEGEITCAYSQSFEYEDNSFDHEFGTHDPGSGYVINEIEYFKIRKLDIRILGQEDAEGNSPVLKTIKTGEISKEEFNNIFSGFNLYETLEVAVNDIIVQAANDGDILPPDNY